MKSLDDLYEIARVFDGIPVLSCVPGSPAHVAGIRYGDVLVRMNGQPTRDLSGYVDARELGSSRVPVTVIRDGLEMELVMELGVVVAAKDGAVAALDHVVEQRLFAAKPHATARLC